MAVGDREGASVRAGIDNVLAKSGTEEGLLLAANHAASAALTAALAASANDVTTPVTDVAALDPELQGRLARVIDRMKTEYGHDVTVVETARSQQRQDSLFAQGRTTPGAIVTWTEDSLHVHGEAVDVLVDGNWNNTKGFARLQQVATEEGLNTLGMKDPGHLELPRTSWTMNADVRVTSASSNGATSNGPVSNGIARVATVARVASVGAGMNIGPAAPDIPSAPSPVLQTNGATGLLPQRRDSNSADSQSSKESSNDAPRDAAARKSLKGSARIDARATNQSYPDAPTDFGTKLIGPVDETQRPSGTSAADAVDRVHDITAMREQQGAKPLSNMTLEVEHDDGTTQQIRMDVRGRMVDTHITADGANADRLRANVGELRTGLESRGLEADSVRISTQNVRTTDAMDGAKHSTISERDAMRLAGTGASNSSTGGESAPQQSGRDRSSTARNFEDKQAARDEQRAQNRDAQGRGSGNQDRQRPQYQEKQ